MSVKNAANGVHHLYDTQPVKIVYKAIVTEIIFFETIAFEDIVEMLLMTVLVPFPSYVYTGWVI